MQDDSSTKTVIDAKATSSFDKLRSFSDIKKEIEQIFPSISESSTKQAQSDSQSATATLYNSNADIHNSAAQKNSATTASPTKHKKSFVLEMSKTVVVNKKTSNTNTRQANNNPFDTDKILKDAKKGETETNEQKLIKPNEKLGPQTDFFSMRKNLLKRVLDNDIRKTPAKKKEVAVQDDPNDFVPTTLLPHIDANDKAESWYKPPDWISDANLVNLVKMQNNKDIEQFFACTEDVDIVKMFPDQKNATNDSPNRWPIKR